MTEVTNVEIREDDEISFEDKYISPEKLREVMAKFSAPLERIYQRLTKDLQLTPPAIADRRNLLRVIECLEGEKDMFEESVPGYFETGLTAYFYFVRYVERRNNHHPTNI